MPNNTFGKFLEELRGKMSLRDASKISGLSHTYIRDLELGFNRSSKSPIKPSPDTLERLSKAYNFPYQELMRKAGYIDGKGNESKSDVQLTPKDEKDIAKRMAKIREDLQNADGGLSFHGEPMSEEAMESVLEALEFAEKTATKINKKYIPKKYREEKE